MGWWTSGGDDDLIGDGPADTLTAALADLAGEGDASPTLPELLDAIAGALREHRGALWSGRDPEIGGLVAVVEPGRVSVAGGGGAPDRQLVHDLAEALATVAEDYLDGLDRLPRLGELLALFAFVLGDRPDEVVAGLSPTDSVLEIRPS